MYLLKHQEYQLLRARLSVHREYILMRSLFPLQLPAQNRCIQDIRRLHSLH
jgi:hypothetical protein